MKGYRIAKPGDYPTIVSKLTGGDPNQVLIYQTKTGISHPLLSLVKAPFEAFGHKFSCYSKSDTQQSLSVTKKRPHELEIGHLPIPGGPFQLLIKT
jgi:hypothetical protein